MDVDSQPRRLPRTLTGATFHRDRNGTCSRTRVRSTGTSDARRVLWVDADLFDYPAQLIDEFDIHYNFFLFSAHDLYLPNESWI
jgi:hypothetical protein